MQILDVQQGTQEWADIRAKHFNASEAPVMMGTSKKATRNDLLRMKATGTEQEFSRWVIEVLFERGHEIEAQARPIAERIIGDELYPATALDDDGYLLASFDGITMLGDVCWECKQWNEAKAEIVRDGGVPLDDQWQLVQQLVVSGAEKCLYMVTDGTEERTVYTWFALDPEDEQRLLAGWQQFDKDLENYEPEEAKPEVVGRSPEQLPALRIEVTGMVTASNLDEFKKTALAVIGSINRDLTTDNDFADAEKTVKWCKDVEQRLEAAKNHALSQTASIDELFRTIDQIKDETRATRLELDKLVKARKQEIRDEILQSRLNQYDAHIRELNDNLGGAYLSTSTGTVPDADFAGAMKGKKTVKSLRDAADTALANAKVEATRLAEQIRDNLDMFKELAAGYESLFADLQTLVTKSADDMVATVKARIAEHKEAEKARLEAERERIRREEQARLEAEQRAASPEPEQQPAPPARHRPAAATGAQAPQDLRTALRAWQDEHNIDSKAMAHLIDLLLRHGALARAA